MIERSQVYQKRTGRLVDSGVNSQLIEITLQMDSDAPFRWTGIGAYFPCGGSILVRWARADGRYVQRVLTGQTATAYGGLVSSQAIGGQWAPVYPNIVMPVQSSLNIQLQNITSGISPVLEDCRLVFTGTKLYPPGAIWAPGYPQRFRSIPFSYRVPVSLPVNSVKPSQQLHVDGDADFVFQGGAFVDGLGGSSNDVSMKFRDDSGKFYMNDYIWIRQLFGLNFTERPGLIYPEIYIPRNQNIFFDVARTDTGGDNAPNAAFVFRGQKVYPL